MHIITSYKTASVSTQTAASVACTMLIITHCAQVSNSYGNQQTKS